MTTRTVASGIPLHVPSPTVDNFDQGALLPEVRGPDSNNRKVTLPDVQVRKSSTNTEPTIVRGALLQQSANQHAVQEMASSTMGNNTSVGQGEQGTSSTEHLNTNAIPFVPCGLASSTAGDTLGHERPIDDVLKDHAEVEKVLNGGKGTPATDIGAWHIGADVPTQSSPVSQLPFSAGDIPDCFVIPAKPVARTSSLKEVRVKFNDTFLLGFLGYSHIWAPRPIIQKPLGYPPFSIVNVNNV